MSLFGVCSASTIIQIAPASVAKDEYSSTLSQSVLSVRQVPLGMRVEIKECTVMGNAHIPESAYFQGRLHEVKNYDEGLKERLNDEYCSLHDSVFLLGTPPVSNSHDQFSLSVSPSLLAQRLMEVVDTRVESEQRDLQARNNGYVSL